MNRKCQWVLPGLPTRTVRTALLGPWAQRVSQNKRLLVHLERLLIIQVPPCSPCSLRLGFCCDLSGGRVPSFPKYSQDFQIQKPKAKPSCMQLCISVACSCHETPAWKRAGTSSGFLVVLGGVVMGNQSGRCSCTQLGSLYLEPRFEKALKPQPYACLIGRLPHLCS